jgi:hypothetical protein
MNEEFTTDAQWADAARRERWYRRVAGAARKVLPGLGLTDRGGRATARTLWLGAAALVAALAVLHVGAQDAGVRRYTDVLAQLAAVKLIDARWDVAVLRSRSGTGGGTGGGAGDAAGTSVQSRDATRIQRALDAALGEAKSNALRSGIAELKDAYAEKADLVTRFQQASADSRNALQAAMRADGAMGNLVRSAWRDFPQRDRLVAAENLVARVLAEAQQYHHAPNAAHRGALESAAADLPRAHSLPGSVEAALSRLDSDVNQLLLLKPLEQMLGERLVVLDTAARADALAETFQRDLGDALTLRNRYQAALLVYVAALLIAAAIYGSRALTRHRELRLRYERQRIELAAALERLHESEPKRSRTLDADSDVVDVEPATVTIVRR